jgi:hypothetical protein
MIEAKHENLQTFVNFKKQMEDERDNLQLQLQNEVKERAKEV